jgi:hypothetical protein
LKSDSKATVAGKLVTFSFGEPASEKRISASQQMAPESTFQNIAQRDTCFYFSAAESEISIQLF